MNSNLAFILIFLLLVILLLFYYIDLESNIIILLGIVIILLIHNIFKNTDHFTINERITQSEAKIDTLIAMAQALKYRDSLKTEEDIAYPSIEIDNSCPFNEGIEVSDDGTPITTERPSEAGLILEGDSQFENIGVGDLSSLYNKINPEK